MEIVYSSQLYQIVTARSPRLQDLTFLRRCIGEV